MKASKAFIKPFEAPQRSVKIKFKLILTLIELSGMHGEGMFTLELYINFEFSNLKINPSDQSSKDSPLLSGTFFTALNSIIPSILD